MLWAPLAVTYLVISLQEHFTAKFPTSGIGHNFCHMHEQLGKYLKNQGSDNTSVP